MTNPIDVSALVNDIKNSASAILQKDVSSFQGFAENQVKAIAKQAELVALGIATGGITAETRQFFLDGLKDMTKNFVNTLVGMEMVTIEKLWNAIVSVIWSAINSAVGFVAAVG